MPLAKKTAGGRQGAKKAVKATRATKTTKATRTARRKTAARGAATRTRKKPASKPSTLGAATAVVRGAAEGAIVAMTRRLPWATGDDPLVQLEKDHRRFEALLKQGEETTERAGKRRRQLLDTLTRELNEHELVEEQVLYPALEPHPEARTIVLEGYEEHHVADVVAKELHGVAPGDERWTAKFKVLKESLEHHIQEEERRMFRTARAVLSREELHQVNVRMKAVKGERTGRTKRVQRPKLGAKRR